MSSWHEIENFHNLMFGQKLDFWHTVDPSSYLADMKNDIVVPVPGMVPEILTGA